MKIIQRIGLFLIICNVAILSGCQNTASGMHQDWKHDTQKIANATGN